MTVLLVDEQSERVSLVWGRSIDCALRDVCVKDAYRQVPCRRQKVELSGSNRSN
ncbi:hypothetical protein [Rhodococcus sp. B50]|uniref:hypothetical protein n=1 Tax=Rhodococcus sp. B50 TaxID=2682847 RepID=UPI001A0E725E|nr:hypothetical protein [Rhodococcus sp. B50]